MYELGDDFMIYSALSRSFDSMLEAVGKNIARLSYSVLDSIDSIFLPEQDQHIKNIISSYDKRDEYPKISHYDSFTVIIPKVIESYREIHKTDNFFFDEYANTYYIIELKAGGDLDNKKAKSEKSEILKEYFMLKNQIAMSDNKEQKIKLFFATAIYNGNRSVFAVFYSRIGWDYWNFVCKSKNGFEIVIDQYKKSAGKIRQTLSQIKRAYNV